MKKLICVLVSAALFLIPVTAQIKNTDWINLGFKGKVKEVDNKSYGNAMEKEGKLLKGSKTDSGWFVFNEKGYLVEKMTSEEVSNIDLMPEMYQYKYDNNENLIEEIDYELTENPAYIKKAMKVDFNFKSVWKSTFTFNNKGKLIEERGFEMPSVLLMSKILYNYDEKGNLVEEINYQENGKVASKTTFRYDGKGNNIEKNDFDLTGKPGRKYTYLYDEKGNIVEYKIFKPDGSSESKETYQYNNKKLVVEYKMYKPDGSLGTKYTYGYDATENLIDFKSYSSDGSVNNNYKYTYEFDKKSNWINKRIYENNKLILVTEREIKYF